MKYHVYCALIATTSARRWADEINSHMPTEADTQAAENKLEDWLNQADTIIREAKPAVRSRNRRIHRSLNRHAREGEQVWKEGIEDLQEAQEGWEEDVMDAQADFERQITDEGILADWEKLVEEVQTEMNQCHMDMKRIRPSLKSLRSRIRSSTNLSYAEGEEGDTEAEALEGLTEAEAPDVLPAELDEVPAVPDTHLSDQFHENAPTPQEIEEAEDIVKEWFERGEKIIEDATPGIEARDRRLVRAWNRAEREEQAINQEMVDELIEAQMEFEEEIMQAERNFEEELTQNGVVADWEALEAKINADLQAMKKFNRRVLSLQRRQAVMQRANTQRNMNLARVSEEMARNSPSPAEWDAIKTKLIDWTTRWHDIAVRVNPIEQRRNREIADATEDRAEEVESTVKGMFEDWERNDREFFQDVEDAENAMLERWETEGTTQKIRDLGADIEATWNAAQQSMIKIKRNINMRKEMFRPVQSLARQQSNGHEEIGQLVEKIKQLPDGEKFKRDFDTVTGWVSDYEAIWQKATPAGERRERAFVDALQDRHEDVVDIVMDADRAHKQKEERFWEDVVHAQQEFELRMEQEGITARAEELGQEIDATFTQWARSHKRVGASTSLARDNLKSGPRTSQVSSLEKNRIKSATTQSLKKLESQIDAVLATL